MNDRLSTAVKQIYQYKVCVSARGLWGRACSGRFDRFKFPTVHSVTEDLHTGLP